MAQSAHSTASGRASSAQSGPIANAARVEPAALGPKRWVESAVSGAKSLVVDARLQAAVSAREAPRPGPEAASASKSQAPENYADLGCKVFVSPYNTEDPDDDPVLVRRVKDTPGRSFDEFFDYAEVDDAPDHEVFGAESGLSNVVAVNTNCSYNGTPSFFFWWYGSMVPDLRAQSDGLGMDWLYLNVASPEAYVRSLEDAGLADEGAADTVSGRAFPGSGWEAATGNTNQQGNVWLLAVVQFYAVYKVESRADGIVKIRYWVGVTLHPSTYPNPDEWSFLTDEWDENDALSSVMQILFDDPSGRAQPGQRIQQFMSCVTSVRARIVTGRSASKNFGFPGNARNYPAGRDSEFGEATTLADWTRTSFPYPLGLTGGGNIVETPTYQMQPYPESAVGFLGAAAVQTTAGADEGTPGAAVSYLGNMMTGIAQFGHQSEWTPEVRAQYVQQGFDCLFGDAVVCSLKLGYIPMAEPGRDSPLHVRASRKLRSEDLVSVRDFRDAMATLKGRVAGADYVYAFGDSDSLP